MRKPSRHGCICLTRSVRRKLLTYFALQLLAGGAALVAPEQSFGIAYFAHIGGFVAGLLLARPMATRWRWRRRSERALAAAVRT